MASERIYRVIFVNQDKVFEVYASHVYPSDLYGFIQVEGFVFGSQTQVVVDPGEEKLKATFSEVTRSHIPMHAVIRIDEVAKEGVSKISEARGAVTPFPLSTPPRRDK